MRHLEGLRQWLADDLEMREWASVEFSHWQSIARASRIIVLLRLREHGWG